MKMLRRWFRVAALAAGILGVAAEGRPAAAAATVGAGLRLVGTVVIEGGKSSALIGEGSGAFWVKEGEDVEPGLRLVEVQTDRVVLKAKDSDEELQMYIGGSPSRREKAAAPVAAEPPAAPPLVRPQKSPLDMTPKELDRLSEDIRADFERLRAERPPRPDRRRRRAWEDEE